MTYHRHLIGSDLLQSVIDKIGPMLVPRNLIQTCLLLPIFSRVNICVVIEKMLDNYQLLALYDVYAYWMHIAI